MSFWERIYAAVVRHGEAVPVEHINAALALHDLRAEVEGWGA